MFVFLPTSASSFVEGHLRYSLIFKSLLTFSFYFLSLSLGQLLRRDFCMLACVVVKRIILPKRLFIG